jgi:O-glycosyl hydrolase
VGSYNAYLWWWLADWNPGNGVTNYGLVDTSNNPTYYGYALAQFSKFVRPGSKRVSATASPSAGRIRFGLPGQRQQRHCGHQHQRLGGVFARAL